MTCGWRSTHGWKHTVRLAGFICDPGGRSGSAKAAGKEWAEEGSGGAKVCPECGWTEQQMEWSMSEIFPAVLVLRCHLLCVRRESSSHLQAPSARGAVEQRWLHVRVA